MPEQFPSVAEDTNSPSIEQPDQLGGNRTPNQLRELISQQRAGYEARGLAYGGGNALAMVHAYNRAMQGGEGVDYREGLVDSAIQAKILADELEIDEPVDPSAVQELLGAGIYMDASGEFYRPQPSNRPLAYPTIEDRQQAADQLIDERLALADSYPYYDLYRQLGMLHEEEGGLPYVELYRSTSNPQEMQLAGGIRSGTFTIRELTELPPSVRLAAIQGIYSTTKVAEYETVFSIDQMEAYDLGDAGQDSSAYLSASRANSDKFAGDTVLTIRIPACLTLPVEFLQAPVERHDAMLWSYRSKTPMTELPEDSEKEIAIVGGVRPEWIVDQRTKPE